MLKLKRFGMGCMATALLVTNMMNVSADSYNSNGNAQMLVTAQVSSTWEVSIPSATNFSIANKSAEYEVVASGDVADTSYLEVIPDEELVLVNDSGLASVTTTVHQDETKWMGTELSDTPITTSGTITAPDDAVFGAGIWSGQLNFTINCNEDTNMTQAKFDLIRTLDFYGAGDSIMEGYGNNYIGVLDNLANTYSAKINKDYSISGSFLTNSGDNGTIGIQKQISNALARLDVEGYTNNTVLVIDGGGNDILKFGQGGSSITVQNMDNPDTDIAAAFSTCWGAITAMQTQKGANAPVVVIVPKLKGEELRDTNAALQSVFTSLQAMASDERFILIDCNNIITDDDILSDNIHMNANGYAKVNKAIVDALYDYYN